jgi:hypothetical protein
MSSEPVTTTVDAERLAHLEALADVVFTFVKDARYIDAHFDQHYTDMGHELRALGYRVRDDIPLRSDPT